MIRTVLSCEPNAEMAKFLTGGGVWSMAALPTAATGEPWGRPIPATSWPTPSATQAIRRPTSIPRHAVGGQDDLSQTLFVADREADCR